MNNTHYLGLENICYGFKKSDCGTQVHVSYQELGHSEFVEVEAWDSSVDLARWLYENLVSIGFSDWGAFSS